MKELINKIEEIFGETLGKGFIARCLEYYKNNVETTTTSLLEIDNLPPILNKLNKKMSIKEAIEELEREELTKSDPNRRTIFDDLNVDSKKFYFKKDKFSNSETNDQEELEKIKKSIVYKVEREYSDEDVDQNMKNYIGNLYDDEPDDSLNQFESYTVNDKDSISKEESDDKENFNDPDEAEPEDDNNNSKYQSYRQEETTQENNPEENEPGQDKEPNQYREPNQYNETQQQDNAPTERTNRGKSNIRGRGNQPRRRGRRGTSSQSRQSKENKHHNRKERGDKKRNIKF